MQCTSCIIFWSIWATYFLGRTLEFAVPKAINFHKWEWWIFQFHAILGKLMIALSWSLCFSTNVWVGKKLTGLCQFSRSDQQPFMLHPIGSLSNGILLYGTSLSGIRKFVALTINFWAATVKMFSGPRQITVPEESCSNLLLLCQFPSKLCKIFHCSYSVCKLHFIRNIFA